MRSRWTAPATLCRGQRQQPGAGIQQPSHHGHGGRQGFRSGRQLHLGRSVYLRAPAAFAAPVGWRCGVSATCTLPMAATSECWSTTVLTTDTVADRVFGQPDFTTVGVACVPPSISSLCYPNGVAVDGAGNLYVVDHQNGRVLEYHSPITTDQVPDRVFGQPDFTTGGGACVPPSASSLCRPLAAAVDGAGNLYVVDHNNHRVLEYDSPVVGSVGGVAEQPGRDGPAAGCGVVRPQVHVLHSWCCRSVCRCGGWCCELAQAACVVLSVHQRHLLDEPAQHDYSRTR